MSLSIPHTRGGIALARWRPRPCVGRGHVPCTRLYMADSANLWIFGSIGIGLVAAALIAFSLWRNAPARRSNRLRERFGPEYDVAVSQYGKGRAARVLEARERRVGKLSIRSLSPSERAGFAQSWRLCQEQFVDAPNAAVSAAHELVLRVMHMRGYPVDDFDQQVADLSVDHGSMVHHFRAAHALEQTNRAGRANTEELRQAMVHYRALFDELLDQTPHQPVPRSQRGNAARPVEAQRTGA